MNATIDCWSELSAILIKVDGRRYDLGNLAQDRFRTLTQFEKFRKLLAKIIGPAAALLMLANLVTAGRIPVLPMLGIVTTVGANYMASDFASGGVTPTISGFKFHDSGTGTNAAVVGDTALQTPTGIARVSGTPSNPSANQYRSVATIAYNNTFAVTEWGLFSAVTAGTLWDRRVFAAINIGVQFDGIVTTDLFQAMLAQFELQK